jgi:hypothetical protein
VTGLAPGGTLEDTLLLQDRFVGYFFGWSRGQAGDDADESDGEDCCS